MKTMILNKSASYESRIETLVLLYKKAEEKVTHADTFRQRNMNYALIIFAGFVAAGIKTSGTLAPYLLSSTLTIIMIIFSVWDRRWHRTKHGWDGTSLECYSKIIELTNNPNNDITFQTYYEEKEETAEWLSWQPIIFYFLVLASIGSFFIFNQNL
jgi:hypothetical protein